MNYSFGFGKLAVQSGIILVLSFIGSAAFAQSAPQNDPPANQPASNGSSVTSESPPSVSAVIAENKATPKSICPAVLPLITNAPESFSEVVTAAAADAELVEPLGECCAVVQKALRSSNPKGAEVVSNILSGATPAFQATCAVSLAEDGTGQNQVVDATSTAESSSAPDSPGGVPDFGSGTDSGPGGGGADVSTSK